MLSDAILDETIATLSSYNGKTKNDPSFDKYKQGIKKALVDFINQCKSLPLAQQLDHITKEMKEKAGSMSAKIDNESNKKRSWTLIFALAALAIERKQDLPKDHQENASIDMLLSGLSNGWVNEFGSIGFGLTLNEEATNNILNGMKSWLQKFDIMQGEQTKHDTLLGLYTSISSLEEKFSSSYLTPKKFKDEMGTIKAQLIDKFNELKCNLEIKNRASVQLIEPLKGLAPREDILYRQFKEQLDHLKKQQEQIQQNIRTFPQEQFKRIAQLQQLLKKQSSESENNQMEQFWKQYDTQERFNQLLSDLDIPENERTGWREYFKYQHGSYREQATSTLWTGGWGLPQFMGGIPSNTICIDVLRRKSDTAIKPLLVIHTRIEMQKMIPDKENPSQLLNSIKEDLESIGGLKNINMDLLGEELVDVLEHKTTNALTKINSEIEELNKRLEQHKKIVQSLKSIHEKIEVLKKHVDCSRVEDTFRLFLNEASNTINQTSQPFPVDLQTAKIITTLEHSVARAQSNVLGLQLSLNQMVKAFNHQKMNIIELVTQFIHAKENTLGHLLLSFFSSSYNIMFNELKDALNEKSTEDCLNKMKAALGITNAPHHNKEIASQFQKLKEEAQEVLSEEPIEEIPIISSLRV
ncbi:hypothetical protein OQJ05_04250 [Fluoribacter gormanii]|uniref:hypothetical protein n=1 Tax=Fluoribacter gormanii TaxID=464 RepID=UPI0022437995|nr:hypothetical protein [Fluoribacter gormanii]MCW8443263.1 hypothetical protein [Fluoribacter gormanii]